MRKPAPGAATSVIGVVGSALICAFVSCTVAVVTSLADAAKSTVLVSGLVVNDTVLSLLVNDSVCWPRRAATIGSDSAATCVNAKSFPGICAGVFCTWAPMDATSLARSLNHRNHGGV